MFTQLITPDPATACTPGMCLQYVRQSYGLPARYGSATEAWNNSATKHRDMNFPAGVWVPLWFAIDTVPAGHVVHRAPDGTIWSSSDMTNVPHHHPSIDDLIVYYAKWGKMRLTYLGWTEDVASFPVVSSLPDVFAQGIITKIQERTMATLDLDDLKAIQGFVQTERTTVVNELRFGFSELGKAIKDSTYELKVWDQTTDNATGDRIINDNRAVEQATRDQLAK
jgi:hypothetical protein